MRTTIVGLVGLFGPILITKVILKLLGPHRWQNRRTRQCKVYIKLQSDLISFNLICYSNLLIQSILLVKLLKCNILLLLLPFCGQVWFLSSFRNPYASYLSCVSLLVFSGYFISLKVSKGLGIWVTRTTFMLGWLIKGYLHRFNLLLPNEC